MRRNDFRYTFTTTLGLLLLLGTAVSTARNAAPCR